MEVTRTTNEFISLLRLLSNTNTSENTANFLNKYVLGVHTEDPTLNNNREELEGGELYWNTTLDPGRYRIYSSSVGWKDWGGVSANSEDIMVNKTLDDISNLIGANHLHFIVRNASGSEIAANTVVTASNTQPGTDYIQVVPLTDNTTQTAVGVMHDSLDNNQTGLVKKTGILNNMNTNNWDVFTILYPNNSGGLTDIKPATGHFQACGIVLRKHSSEGTILVEFSEPKRYATTSEAGVAMLADNLTTNDATKSLTARMGKMLQNTKAALSGLYTQVFRVADPIDDYDAVNKRTLEAAVSSVSEAKIAAEAAQTAAEAARDEAAVSAASIGSDAGRWLSETDNITNIPSRLSFAGSYIKLGDRVIAVANLIVYTSKDNTESVFEIRDFPIPAESTVNIVGDVVGSVTGVTENGENISGYIEQSSNGNKGRVKFISKGTNVMVKLSITLMYTIGDE